MAQSLIAENPTVREFILRFQDFEKKGDVGPLAALFADDAVLSNLTRSNTHTKQDEVSRSAKDFWRRYRMAFAHVSSHFTNVIADADSACLEWTAQGALPNSLPIEYSGVSVLELDGEKIASFRAYYDSAAFFPHAPHDRGYAQTVGELDASPQVSE